MNLAYQQLNTALPQLPAGAIVRNQVMAAAIALAISARLPLPSGPVQDVENHWNFHVAGLLNDPLSEINEGAVFDIKAAVAFARQFWLLRYASAHPSAQLSFADQSPFGFFDTLAGVALYVSPENHAFVNEHKACIFQLAVLATRLINEHGACEVVNG